MPRFKVETNVEQRRTYFVEAADAAEAETKVSNGDVTHSHEEDANEETADVTEVSAEEIAAEIAA